MTAGDKFYTWQAYNAGLFGADPWVIFHNPGIINKAKAKSPPALTDTSYLEHFVSLAKSRGAETVSIVGFSAGSMLALAMAGRGDEIDQSAAGAARPKRFIDCAVAIHGPDKIADAFESVHKSRFDLK